MLNQANSGHEGHDHGSERDSHGRKANNEHYGHDHK
jgi:trigger factor